MPQSDGGEAWAEVGGQFVIVERHDGYVVGNLQIGLAKNLIGAEGEAIVQAEERAGRRALPQQLLDQFIAMVRRPLPAAFLGNEVQPWSAMALLRPANRRDTVSERNRPRSTISL